MPSQVSILQTKKQARAIMHTDRKRAVLLGIVPMLLMMLLLYLLSNAAANIAMQMPRSSTYAQVYNYVQKTMNGNPNFFLYVYEGQLAYAMINVGVHFSALDWIRRPYNKAKNSIADAFQVFSGRYFFKVIILWIIIYFVNQLGYSLFFVIGGIFFSCAFRMSYFILKDVSNKQSIPIWSLFKLMGMSWRLMSGYKMKLFMLDLSFIFWDIINFLTMGLVNIYVAPYKATSYAIFYQSILQEKATRKM